jgi:hypothetical protein
MRQYSSLKIFSLFFPELNDPARPAAAQPMPWARSGRAGGRAQRGADESTLRIGGSGGPSLSCDTSSTNLPGSATAGSS